MVQPDILLSQNKFDESKNNYEQALKIYIKTNQLDDIVEIINRLRELNKKQSDENSVH